MSVGLINRVGPLGDALEEIITSRKAAEYLVIGMETRTVLLLHAALEQAVEAERERAAAA